MKKTPPTPITDAILHAIATSDLSRAAIARGCGLNKCFLSKFLSGERSLTLTTADKVAAFFGLRLAAGK